MILESLGDVNSPKDFTCRLLDPDCIDFNAKHEHEKKSAEDLSFDETKELCSSAEGSCTKSVDGGKKHNVRNSPRYRTRIQRRKRETLTKRSRKRIEEGDSSDEEALDGDSDCNVTNTQALNESMKDESSLKSGENLRLKDVEDEDEYDEDSSRDEEPQETPPK